MTHPPIAGSYPTAGTRHRSQAELKADEDEKIKSLRAGHVSKQAKRDAWVAEHERIQAERDASADRQRADDLAAAKDRYHRVTEPAGAEEGHRQEHEETTRQRLHEALGLAPEDSHRFDQLVSALQDGPKSLNTLCRVCRVDAGGPSYAAAGRRNELLAMVWGLTDGRSALVEEVRDDAGRKRWALSPEGVRVTRTL